MNDHDPDLKSLDERLKKARAQVEPEVEEDKASPLGMAWKLGMELVVGVVAGALLGLGLDDLLGTKPLFMILMLFLGFGAGVRNVFREASRMQTQMDAEDNAKEK